MGEEQSRYTCTTYIEKFISPAENNTEAGALDHLQWKERLSLVSYGIRIVIRVNEPKVLELLLDYLPPEWKPSSSPFMDELYSIIVAETPESYGTYPYHQLYHEQEKLLETTALEEVFETLDSDLRLRVGMTVRDKLFVHAGVVGWRGKAIVIPGRSFSGKTTLVAELVKAGANYYSDEYAVFDTDGLVHPYSRRLSIREESSARVKRCSVEELGGKSGTEPLSVGLIIQTEYQSGVQWSPQKISAGQAVLALLDNTIVARLRPEFALPVLSRAVSGALALEGERGEAKDTAMEVLKQLEA